MFPPSMEATFGSPSSLHDARVAFCYRPGMEKINTYIFKKYIIFIFFFFIILVLDRVWLLF